MKRTSVFVIAGATLLAVGCGGSKGTITGTVTYKGKPIPSGYIVFVPDNGARPANSPIMDGKYTAEDVPTGPAKVTISSLHMEGPRGPMAKKGAGAPGAVLAEKMGKMGPPSPDLPMPPEIREKKSKGADSFGQARKGIRIPDKYADPEKSGLTYTVQSGQQTKDFNLE